MCRKSVIMLAAFAFIASMPLADTFRHRQTGDIFHGFVTGKRSADKILVYNSQEKLFKSIQPADYQIERNGNGRRQTIVVIPIRQPEILLSGEIANRVSAALVDAANAGPQMIVLDIDNPGGRGETMKQIAETLLTLRFCPTAAFISGGPYGGAFSSAAVIAAACETVYIAPNASVGAVSPMVGAMTDEQYRRFVGLHSPDALQSYSAFAMNLTTNPSVRAVLKGLVDKTISLVEVADADGKTLLIERDNRAPNQTIARTLAEGRLTAGDAQSTAVIGRTLMLSAADAVKYGFAAKLAGSISEIAADQQIQNAAITTVGDIEAMVKRFSAAQRTVNRTLAVIDQLEQQASRLDEQIATIEERMRTATVQREVGQIRQQSALPRRNIRIGGYADYDQPEQDSVYNPPDRFSRRVDSPRQRRRATETERIVTEFPAADLDQLRSEYAGILNDLISQYRSAITLARRWDGILPPETPMATLEANMNSAVVQWERITGRSMRRLR